MLVVIPYLLWNLMGKRSECLSHMQQFSCLQWLTCWQWASGRTPSCSGLWKQQKYWSKEVWEMTDCDLCGRGIPTVIQVRVFRPLLKFAYPEGVWKGLFETCLDSAKKTYSGINTEEISCRKNKCSLCGRKGSVFPVKVQIPDFSKGGRNEREKCLLKVPGSSRWGLSQVSERRNRWRRTHTGARERSWTLMSEAAFLWLYFFIFFFWRCFQWDGHVSCFHLFSVISFVIIFRQLLN